jgi:hypothetical protein
MVETIQGRINKIKKIHAILYLSKILAHRIGELQAHRLFAAEEPQKANKKTPTNVSAHDHLEAPKNTNRQH